MTTAPIGPRTVTINSSHWRPKDPWSGFDWSRAWVRASSIFSPSDYHLNVPWLDPDEPNRAGIAPDDWPVYRVRLKNGWGSFVLVDGGWVVSREGQKPDP